MKALWKFLTSLRLTVYLLAMSVALVFFGTLDQVHDGIYLTQQRYFEHVFVVWRYPMQLPFAQQLGWLHLPLPGGYLIGPLLVINLTCAHFRYYRAGWRKFGIAFLHMGVVVLLLGQLIAQVAQKENFMWLAEGHSSNYLESFRDDELVVIDRGAADHDRVYAWPTAAFSHRPTTLRHPELPFAIDVAGYMLNAAIASRSDMPNGPDLGITQGIGVQFDLTAMRQEPTYADNERNRKTAIVDLRTPDGTLGRWIVSNAFDPDPQPGRRALPRQTFTYQDREYEIALRPTRTYLPAHIRLLDFSHDRYPGTQIPYNFSSKVQIIDDESRAERSNLIYMNHPMRFAGFTFYQASFANNDTMSMFQVVRNPGRWVPYIACSIVTLGMLWQFLFGLYGFVQRHRSKSSPPAR